MERSLSVPILRDLKKKIVLLAGPRQVGKTTLSKSLVKNFDYLNYDSSKDRKLIRQNEWRRDVELVILDEIHKKLHWKAWVKGIYDTEGIPPALLLTGSARLDTFRKGGDSLAGRHFHYRLYPFTVKELRHQMEPRETLRRILKFGGFPEPFVSDSDETAERWRRGHLDVILRQDLLDLERVREIRNIEILIELLADRVGSTVSFQSLAEDIGTSSHTIKHWLEILERLFVIFKVTPFSRNISAAIKKESKYYFHDVGQVTNGEAARLENVVASALLSEISFQEDTKGKKGSLHFIRNKQKQEIDFLVLSGKKPRLLVEVKQSDDSFSSPLIRFFEKLRTDELRAYQVVGSLNRRKEKSGVQMISAVDFLSRLEV